MTIARVLLSWLLALSLLLGGCGRSGLSVLHELDGSIDAENSSSPASSNPLPNGQCPSGLAQCGKDDAARCYDIGRSRDHCGACGRACALGIACQNGKCQQYRCKGTLTFKALAATNTGDPYQPPSGDRFTLGDFDGDGVLDLVGLPEAGAPMSLLFGAGDGTFPARRTVDASAFHHWQACAADLDGDDKLDLAGIREDQAAVTVRLGSGNRDVAFGAPTSYATGETPTNLLLADLDGDGRLDLVAGEQSTLEYWRGESGGHFARATTLASRSEGPGWRAAPVLQAADWNRDGVPDLVYGGPNLHLRYGLGDGSFGQEAVCGLALDTPAVPPGRIAADVDHDGHIDLAVRETGVLLGLDGCNPNRIVSIFNPFQISTNWTVELADLDGDDNLDILTALNLDGTDLAVYIGNGKGDFAKPLSFPSVETANGGAFLVGDLNRDGRLDVIVSGEGAWRVLLNTCQ